MRILVLAGRHVRELLPYRECAEVMRQALADLARGQIQQPLRTVVRPLTSRAHELSVSWGYRGRA
jgi:ornithine cyclodeaminase/alanine dehydrogenase-like protein (mu-crystallin family)